jgi:hypothetical protein
MPQTVGVLVQSSVSSAAAALFTGGRNIADVLG